MSRYLLLFFAIIVLASSCSEKSTSGEEEPQPVNFDRRAMLTEWADEVIIPAYERLDLALSALETARTGFRNSANEASLTELKGRFQETYLAFQEASPLMTGKPEEIRFREQFNTYPTDVALIENNISAIKLGEEINFDLPSQSAAQGFPALEYILYSVPTATLLANPESEGYHLYFEQLIPRLQALNETVLADWAASRDAYIQNDGNSATASIDRTVNDYIFYYEKFLRAGKVGIPAGVFSDAPLPDRTESFYAGQSKVLFIAALDNTASFFADHGLANYLDAINVMRDGEPLSQKIMDQFAVIKNTATPLNDNFAAQVTEDNTQLLRLYDEMQKLIVLLKVDMLQALSINVDYVDADGD